MKPIAIGGVGGSGTRVIAEILKRLGFYIGSDLNSANDNLWFTVLFKRPDWFSQNLNNELEILKALSTFKKIMTGEKLNTNDRSLILKAAKEISKKGHDKDGNGRGLWPYKRLITMFLGRKFNPLKHRGWGWKEPNTHIYLPFLLKAFNEIKYIHVIRNGLDMAFSKNQAQLFNWGPFLGVSIDTQKVPLPKLSLHYWIKANNRVREIVEASGNRCLMINFDKLCLSPEMELNHLLEFIGIKIDNKKFTELKKIIKIPSTIGRYKKHDLSVFSREEVEEVKKFGFSVE